ncbi:MAG: YcaQ family DNA glycosylase [Bacteroidetes bacterium]|nr:YcaQ family DNA glycosylase [Bacteroidota bacterium]
MKLPIEISLQDARFLALKNQKLLERDNHYTKKDLHKIIEKIGYVQIDTISIVERAHHHILWTRLPVYKKTMLDELMKEKKVFEYWSHAAAFLPMKDYRYSLRRKENYKERYKAWSKKNKKIIDFARDRITAEGPLQSKDFEHPPRVKSGWWDWKPAKEALEYLFHAGELMVAERKNFQKVYDLTERVLPKKIDTTVPTYEEHCQHLIMNTVNANGFASQKEMFYLRGGDSKIPMSVINRMIEEKKILPVNISGITKELTNEKYYTTKENLKQLKNTEFEKDVHILSPFDNLVIQRKRLKTLFNFDYVIECYVPAPKRKFGYYVLPIVYGDKFIGRLDAKADRQNDLFKIINLWWENKAKPDKNFKKIFKKRIDELTAFSGCGENNLDKFIK